MSDSFPRPDAAADMPEGWGEPVPPEPAGPLAPAAGPTAAHAGDRADDGRRRAAGLLAAIAAGWRAFAGWRRRRPFWGGLLLLISGTELLMIPLPIHAMGLILHIGTGGVLGILIGAILIVCGLLLWFNPAQRIFYSIVAVLLAVAALVASNLGGFLLGTLLGVIGGSLGFGWAPLREGAAGRGKRRRGRTPAGSTGSLGALLGRHKGTKAGNDGAVIRGFGTFPVVLITVAGLLHQSAATISRPSFCLPGLPPIPILNPCPSPAPAPGSPSPSTTGSASVSPSPGPSGSLSDSPSPSGSSSPSAGATPSPAAGTPGPSPSPRTGTAPAFAVASAPSSLTAASAVITGFAYDGTVTVRTTSGTVRLMQFSMSSLALTSVDLSTGRADAVITTRAPGLSLAGNVILYASKLSGDVLGVPISITPGSPLATILRVLAPLTKAVGVPMTNVVTDQPFTSADSVTASGLDIS